LDAVRPVKVPRYQRNAGAAEVFMSRSQLSGYEIIQERHEMTISLSIVENLSILLARYLKQNCQDPRDSAYGLLGLTSELSNYDVPVRYGQPVAEFYGNCQVLGCRSIPLGSVGKQYAL
jgi:hypothetical protein